MSFGRTNPFFILKGMKKSVRLLRKYFTSHRIRISELKKGGTRLVIDKKIYKEKELQYT